MYTTFAAPRTLLCKLPPRIPLSINLTIASSIIAVFPVDVGADHLLELLKGKDNERWHTTNNHVVVAVISSLEAQALRFVEIRIGKDGSEVRMHLINRDATNRSCLINVILTWSSSWASVLIVAVLYYVG